MLVIVGCALLLVAAPVAMVAAYWGRLWRAMRQLGIMTPDALVEAADATRARGQPMKQLCAVVGTAKASAKGALTSVVNRELCVWYRYDVVHRQVRQRRDSAGRLRRSSRRKRLGATVSHDPFLLVGRVGRVEVRPDNMRVHRAERGRTRILPGMAEKPFPDADLQMGDGAVQNSFHHKEWIVREGAQLYVLGEATRMRDAVVLSKPAKGPHLVSTLTGTQLLGQAQRMFILTVVVAIVSATTGMVMVIVGLLR
jgi:hypothetical protein